MGKGTIVSHLGGGQYSVDVHHQSSRPEKMVKYYHDLYLTTFQDELLAADDAVTAAKNAFYNESTKPNGLDVIIPLLAEAIQEYTFLLALGESAQGGTEDINQARAKVEGLLSACAIATEELERLRLEWILAIEAQEEVIYRFKEYARLEAVWQIRVDKAVGVDTHSLWCIDLAAVGSENADCVGYAEIPNGTEVGLLDVDCIGDTETMFIDTAFPSGLENKYSPEYGMLEHKLNQTPEGWIYNMAMYPGLVTWGPKWGFGQIFDIDYVENTCTVERYASWTAQEDSLPYPRNWDSRGIADPYDGDGQPIVYEDVPIEYMDCNATAFQNRDYVIVEVPQSGKPSKVIGFQNNPRACNVPRVVCNSAPYIWSKDALAWEVDENIPLRVGSDITWTSNSSCTTLGWTCSSPTRTQALPFSTTRRYTSSHNGESLRLNGVVKTGPGGPVIGACLQGSFVYCAVALQEVTGWYGVEFDYTLIHTTHYLRIYRKPLTNLINNDGIWSLQWTGTDDYNLMGNWLWNASGTKVVFHAKGIANTADMDDTGVITNMAPHFMQGFLASDWTGDTLLTATLRGTPSGFGSNVNRTLLINDKVVSRDAVFSSAGRCNVLTYVHLDIRDTSNIVAACQSETGSDEDRCISYNLIHNGTILHTVDSSAAGDCSSDFVAGVTMPGGEYGNTYPYGCSVYQALWAGVKLNSGAHVFALPVEYLSFPITENPPTTTMPQLVYANANLDGNTVTYSNHHALKPEYAVDDPILDFDYPEDSLITLHGSSILYPLKAY